MKTALVLCGGRGTRLEGDVEKPLYPIANEPMVDRVCRALEASAVARVRPVVSPNAPRTAAHVGTRYETIRTAGDGYVADLTTALETAGERPVLTVAADLPLLSGSVVDRLLNEYDGEGSLTVVVPRALKREYGLSIDHGGEYVPAGLNVVDPTAEAEAVYTSRDVRLAVNVNTRRDVRVAEVLVCD